MTHFGLLCPTAIGHVNRMTSLGYTLKERGHQVTLFTAMDAKPKVIAAGLDFVPIGGSEFPLGTATQLLNQLGTRSGVSGLRTTVSWIPQWVATLLREAPDAIRAAQVEALVVDQTAFEGGTIAELLELPFVNICDIIHHQHPSVPPYCTSWQPNPAQWARWRNQIGYRFVNQLHQPIWKVVTAYRQAWRLPRLSSLNDAFSQRAVVSQLPLGFDFPRDDWSPIMHYTGPLYKAASRSQIPFPYEKLTGQPLIYASMGTLQNRLVSVFQQIAAACVGLEAQLVISLGGALKPEALPELPGCPLVVGYAPQLELLQLAQLTITHGGANTMMESLSYGVPLVVIPVTNDQPGMAARLVWQGAGEAVSLRRLSVPRLRQAIQRVLQGATYKANAVRLQQAIRDSGGSVRAAAIIEQAVAH